MFNKNVFPSSCNLKLQKGFIRVPKLGAGFTFVELLVVIVAMSLLFGLGYANYRDFARKQSLEAAARRAVGDLRYAQQLASSGSNKPAGCGVLNGYQFDVYDVPPKRAYRISAVCDDNEVTVIKVVELDEDIYMDSPSIEPILFKVLEQGTNIPEGTSVEIPVAQVGNIRQPQRPDWKTYGADSINVVVTSGGEVYSVYKVPEFIECSGGMEGPCEDFCQALGKTCVENCTNASCTGNGYFFYNSHTGTTSCRGCTWPYFDAATCDSTVVDIYCCCE